MKDGTDKGHAINKSCTDDQTIIQALVQLILTIRSRYPKLPKMAREKRQNITKLLLEELVKCCPEHSFLKEIKSKIGKAEKVSPEKEKMQYPYWQRGDVIIGKYHYQQLFPLSFWLVAKNDFLLHKLQLEVFSERSRSLNRFLEFLKSAQYYPSPVLSEIDMNIVLNIIQGTQYKLNRFQIVQLARKQIIKQFELQKSRAVLMQRYAFIVNTGITRFKHRLNYRPFGLKLFVKEVLKPENLGFIPPTFQKTLISINRPTTSLQEWILVVRREEFLPKYRKGVKFSPVQKIVVTHNPSLKNWSEFLVRKSDNTHPEENSSCTQVSLIQRQRKNVFEFIQRYPRETIRLLEIRSMYPHHKLSSLRSVFGGISLYQLKKVSRILREEDIMKMTAIAPDFFPNRIFISLHRQTKDIDYICSFLSKFPMGLWFYTSKKIFLFIYLSHRRFGCGVRELIEFRNEIDLLEEEFQISVMVFSKVYMSASWFPFKLIKEEFSFN